MRRHIQLWGSRTLAVALVAVALQQWGVPLYRQYFTPKKITVYVPTSKVSVGPFVVSFHEMGAVKAEKSVSFNSEVEGKIMYLVPEGRVVKKGDKLVELDTSEMQRDVRQKQLALKNADAEVKRARAEFDILKEENRTKVAEAEATLGLNKVEHDAAQEQSISKKALADEKLIPKTEATQAEMNLRAKELEVTKGEMELKLQKKDVESKESQKTADVRQREYAQNMSKLDLEDIERRVKKAVITAPSAGMVVLNSMWMNDSRRKLKAGDSTWRRQTIGELPDLSSMQVTVNVGEADAPKVRVGMPTLIRLEAVRNRVFHGTVKEISSLATEKEFWEAGATPGKKNFEVTIQITEVDPNVLKPGMTADVEFVVQRIEKAVYAPIESVVEREGKTYVFLMRGKQWRRTSIVTGDFNDNFVCIKKGLKKGEIVALRDPTRPLEQQESGSMAPGADEKKDKEQTKPAPIPGPVKK